MRFLLKTIGFLLAAGVILAVAALAWGHIHIRRIAPPLPKVEEILEADREADLPVRLTWINTASQAMPRSVVLEPELDPNPDDAYTMSHSAFVVEWQDGRIFLIDMGMDAKAAIDFGLPNEIVVDAEPIEPHGSTSSKLGESRTRVAGIAFTHMHVDHTAGLTNLCRDLGALAYSGEPIPVFQHHYQMAEVNHTTRGPKAQLQETHCIEQRNLGADGGLLPIPGFPGVFAVPAGGHTPGSTMYVVQLRVFPGESDGPYNDIQTWVITGDVVNHLQGIEGGIPKPRLYSLLVVPENDARLGKVRTFLKDLSKERGVELLVSHDRKQIESTEIPTY